MLLTEEEQIFLTRRIEMKFDIETVILNKDFQSNHATFELDYSPIDFATFYLDAKKGDEGKIDFFWSEVSGTIGVVRLIPIVGEGIEIISNVLISILAFLFNFEPSKIRKIKIFLKEGSERGLGRVWIGLVVTTSKK